MQEPKTFSVKSTHPFLETSAGMIRLSPRNFSFLPIDWATKFSESPEPQKKKIPGITASARRKPERWEQRRLSASARFPLLNNKILVLCNHRNRKTFASTTLPHFLIPTLHSYPDRVPSTQWPLQHCPYGGRPANILLLECSPSEAKVALAPETGKWPQEGHSSYLCDCRFHVLITTLLLPVLSH